MSVLQIELCFHSTDGRRLYKGAVIFSLESAGVHQGRFQYPLEWSVSFLVEGPPRDEQVRRWPYHLRQSGDTIPIFTN